MVSYHPRISTYFRGPPLEHPSHWHATTFSRQLRDNKYLVRPRILHFAPRRVAADVYVPALGVKGTEHIPGLVRDPFCRGIRRFRRGWRSGFGRFRRPLCFRGPFCLWSLGLLPRYLGCRGWRWRSLAHTSRFGHPFRGRRRRSHRMPRNGDIRRSSPGCSRNRRRGRSSGSRLRRTVGTSLNHSHRRGDNLKRAVHHPTTLQ